MNMIERFKIELKNRNYASSTIKTYSKHLIKFYNKLGDPVNVKADKIAEYLSNIESPVARRQAYSSINFFLKILYNKKCHYDLRNIKSSNKSPYILANYEINQIINTIDNSKHRLMISMLYGSGLRVSEVVNLQIKDIDIVSKIVNIRQAKGQKDRFSIISSRLINPLDLMMLNKSCNEYLFTTISNNKYSVRTVQTIFTKALKNSGIKKKATCHTLRHSFATHLLEKGVNIGIVKKLLGHKSIKTTLIYLHLADNSLKNIQSPL